MNLREMQFVSDHLTEHECRKLSEALSMEDYVLDHTVTGRNEKNVSCITLLLTWDRSELGRARSFHRLSLRLSQIGRKDLSQKLAQFVYDEKSDEVRYILCRQYHKLIEIHFSRWIFKVVVDIFLTAKSFFLTHVHSISD